MRGNTRYWRLVVGGIIAVSMVFSASAVVLAADPATAGLSAEIEVLKERLSKLENELTAQQAGAEPGSAVVQLPSGFHGVQMSGFVDTSYTYNFNEPTARTNSFRVFDTRSGDFMINNAELVIEKPVSAEAPIGFRTDLNFGADAEVVGSVTTGLGSQTDELDLQQGYVEYLAPIGNGLDLKFGKFVTLHGAEVIEAKDNWNFSRSYLFGFAIPFTHTGLRASYPWTEWLTTCFGVNNGWDVVDDNNKAKTLEFSATLTPFERFSLISTYMLGAEQTSDSRDQRHLIDLVASYQPIDKLTLKLNFDYGAEQDAVDEAGGGDATWNGVALYAKYDITDKWSMAGRWEVFNDQDGVRTAVNSAASSPTGDPITDLRLMEWTFTTEYKLNAHLIARLEYRVDQANEQVFRHHQGLDNAQNTLAVEFIAPF
ncbi:MAG: porin [Candidatus Omnitrophica bacterium]|nr:porin [Candidatus Omnitrophota bacterium]